MNTKLLEYIDEGGFEPWIALNLNCGGYSSVQDDHAIAIMECISDGLYSSDIAKKTGLSEPHVELWQYIFCSADWCEYGTSPRGCFPVDAAKFRDRIEKWKIFRKIHWED